MRLDRLWISGALALSLCAALIACDDSSLPARNAELEKQIETLKAENAALKARPLSIPTEGQLSADELFSALKCSARDCYAPVRTDPFREAVKTYVTAEGVGRTLDAKTVSGFLDNIAFTNKTDKSSAYVAGWVNAYFPLIRHLGLYNAGLASEKAQSELQDAVYEKMRKELARPSTLRALYTGLAPAIHAVVVERMDRDHTAEYADFARRGAKAFAHMTDAGLRSCLEKRLVSEKIHVFTFVDGPTRDPAYLSCLARVGATAELATVYAFAYRRWTEGGAPLLAEYQRIAEDIAAAVAQYVKDNTPAPDPTTRKG